MNEPHFNVMPESEDRIKTLSQSTVKMDEISKNALEGVHTKGTFDMMIKSFQPMGVFDQHSCHEVNLPGDHSVNFIDEMMSIVKNCKSTRLMQILSVEGRLLMEVTYKGRVIKSWDKEYGVNNG